MLKVGIKALIIKKLRHDDYENLIGLTSFVCDILYKSKPAPGRTILS